MMNIVVDLLLFGFIYAVLLCVLFVHHNRRKKKDNDSDEDGGLPGIYTTQIGSASGDLPSR